MSLRGVPFVDLALERELRVAEPTIAADELPQAIALADDRCTGEPYLYGGRHGPPRHVGQSHLLNELLSQTWVLFRPLELQTEHAAGAGPG